MVERSVGQSVNLQLSISPPLVTSVTLVTLVTPVSYFGNYVNLR